jgi:hypothetical protein
MTRITRIAACAALLSAPALAHAQAGGPWDWSVAPYIWGASVNTDVTLARPPASAGGFTKFEDIVDKLDGAFLVHGEGQGDDWGVFADYIWFGLSDDDQRQFLRTETDIDLSLFELAGVWAPHADRGRGFEAFAGLRHVEVDLTLQLIPNNQGIVRASVGFDQGYDDLMVGARYIFPLSDRWTLTLRGDGSWGDTDGTWNASAVALYQMTNGAWAFGWRHLNVELQREGEGTRVDAALDGPLVGYNFQF